MTQDLKVLAVTSCGGFFLQGERQEKSLQRELVRGVWGAWGVGEKGLGSFFYRESYKRRAYRESLTEACGVLGVLVRKVWGIFYRESDRRRAAERACQRRVGACGVGEEDREKEIIMSY